MAHLSLYRKFRPNTFDDLVRQEHVSTVLKNQIGTGTVGHAYLFCGPRGTGKTSVARIFARAVNCESPKNGSPCGVCPTCKALAEGSLDVTEIDAASNNGVAEMRDLREKVQYPPVTGKYKVYIVDEVHMLTDSAFNALLKTLEEPPAHAIFILATTEPHKIPATILSRCMRLDFKLLPEEDLENHLKRILKEIGREYEEEAVSAIARAGAGSDRDMLSIAEMCLAYQEKLTYEGVTSVLGAADFNETASLCEALLAFDMSATIERTETILSAGKSVGVLCKDILATLNRIAVAKTCRTAEKLLSLPKAQFTRISEIAQKADGRAVLRATEILARTETDLRLVSSPRICLETALMKIAVPAADESVDALVARLNALEKRLAEGNFAPAQAAAPSAIPAQTPDAVTAPVSTATAEETDYEFPTEEPVFEEAFFPDEPVRPARERAAEKTEKTKTERAEGAPAPYAESPKPLPATPAEAANGVSAEIVYGKFMRLLRRMSKNGVLFTMCTDLDAKYEENTLVLYTESETVLRSLSKEEHVAIMKEVFSQLGVTSFCVKLKSAQQKSGGALEQFRKDFGDYPIEIK